jgi:flagellar operon protein (TIGR03826 family)
MDVMNCPRCGKMFKRLTVSICEKCVKLDETEFLLVRDFLEENRQSTMKDVVDATKVSSKRILKWIKEGRLEMTDGMEGALRCLGCNKPIKTGRYCDRCVLEINENVTHLFEKKKTMGMHTFGKDKK